MIESTSHCTAYDLCLEVGAKEQTCMFDMLVSRFILDFSFCEGLLSVIPERGS